MTFEQAMLERLIKTGLSDTQAKAVVDQAKIDESFASFVGRWNDDVSGYPDIMQNMVWSGVKHITLKWIDTNLPQAWYRPMFVT